MYSSDTESSEDELGILKKALDVHLPDDFDPTSIPQTGEEYLQHVIYERTNKCKKWVTAEGDFTHFNKNQTVHVTQDTGVQKALSKFYPNKKWQDNSIRDFTQLRVFLNNTEKRDSTIECINLEQFLKIMVESPPKFSELIEYSQAAKVMMLHEITKYLNNFDCNTGIPHNTGTWIYGILALLEKPLTPDCCFKLREFAKKCANIRAKLQDDVDECVAIPLNLYICIIARYFNQLDLAD